MRLSVWRLSTLHIAEILPVAFTFVEETQSHPSPLGIFETLLQRDLSITGLLPQRLRHLDFVEYKPEAH